MNPVIAEWVQKAEGDYSSALRLYRSRPPLLDHACFHAQQSVEKYLKARLTLAMRRFPKTHDLSALLKLCAVYEPLWIGYSDAFKLLNNSAVLVRYPGNSATSDHARSAVATMREFRDLARQSLGLSSDVKKKRHQRSRSKAPRRSERRK
jgi:HEPN domain-containing protein